jgi:DNA-binding MarR family transcriptional regulator
MSGIPSGGSPMGGRLNGAAAAAQQRSGLGDDLTMAELTAAEVLALSALMRGRPMTSAELARSVSDMGMHLDLDDAAATIRSLTEEGLAERTPAASLGKYRITVQGRAWLTSRTASEGAKGEARRGDSPLRK